MVCVPPPCTECGACCAHHDPKWVEVTAADASRIPVELLQAGDIQPFALKMGSGRCAALAGIVGRETACRIYEQRPAICRNVQRGDALCAFMLGYHRLPLPFDYGQADPGRFGEPR